MLFDFVEAGADPSSQNLAWGAIATAGAATMAAIVGVGAILTRWVADSRALRQKEIAEGRAEWWRRAEWAIDRACSDNPSQRVAGLLSLTDLADSALVGPAEIELLVQVGTRIADEIV